MEILRALKNNEPISTNLATGLIIILEIQILALFFVNQRMPLYSDIINFVFSSSPISNLILINLVINLVQLFFIVFMAVILYSKNKTKQQLSEKSSVLRILEIKPYLLFVQIACINSVGIKSYDRFTQVASSFNLLFILIEIFALKTINVSYRFKQSNHIRRKNNSLIPWILILGIVFGMNYFTDLYGSFFLLLRSLAQMYYNYYNLESQEIRGLQWFFPLISIELTFGIIIQFYLDVVLFDNLVHLTFLILLAVYCSKHISEVLSFQILKYHLKKSNYILDNQSKQQNSQNQLAVSLNENQMEKIILQLRIMTKIYMSRLKYIDIQQNQPQNSDNFDFWWMFWDRFFLQHKVYCSNVNCFCTKFVCRGKQTPIMQNKLFAQKIYYLIKKVQNQSSGSQKKLKIIENYFLIQLDKKPLKTYYQLVKLFSGSLSRQQILEVQNLMSQTRTNFKQLFIKQKVENSDLDVQPLFEFQYKLQDMRSQMNEMALQYRKFYQIFGSNFVQMQSLKKQTRLLTNFKLKFTSQIEESMNKFNKSIELMTFGIAYYCFFDEYTNLLDRIKTKAQNLHDLFANSHNQLRKQTVQIFNPNFGAVKADLVFHPGRIITISKNLCHILGFTHREIAAQKVNKLMPYMFARIHDKILKNFVENSSMKMLKYKEKVYYARAASKFIVPITMRLKVDYSNADGMCAIAFIKPTPTRSEFILMNNYGKVEEMTKGIYNKFFQKAFNEQLGKIKKLSACKMLLSLNYFLKDATQADETVREGFFLTSQHQNVLNSYFKLPQLGITPKKQPSLTSSKSMKSARSIEPSQTYSGSNDMDFSDDLTNFNVDMKESLKDYFKKLDTNKVTGYRVSYKIQDYITNDFRCKILEIISIRDQMTGKQLENWLRSQIIEISQYFGLDQVDYARFKQTDQEDQVIEEGSQLKLKKRTAKHLDERQQNSSLNGQNEQQIDGGTKYHIDRGDSDASSVISTNEVIKKKQTLISAFEKQTIINEPLQYGLTFLILLMAMVLLMICIFSIRLEGNYQSLQHDNLTIMNFRIDFLLRLGIRELQLFYKSFNMTQPAFLEQKRIIVQNKMKGYLQRTIKWIDISWPGYIDKFTVKYADQNYTRNMSIYYFMTHFYATFVGNESLSGYFGDNYIVLATYLVNLGNKEELQIMTQSLSYRSTINVIVIFYSCILFLVIIVAVVLLKISYQKQSKIIDFLPFLKSSLANKKVLFYEKFYEYNKQSQNMEIQQIQKIDGNQQSVLYGQTKKLKDKNQLVLQSNSKFLRVVKNQKHGLSFKVVLFGILILLLCLFVIFFSEYFFYQSHQKFNAYLKLKNSAMLVQLSPSRLIMLYIINMNKLLNNKTMIVFPDSYSGLAHDRLFQLQANLACTNFSGSQMENIISKHFTKQICDLVPCTQENSQNPTIKNQQVYYLSYRIVHTFNYVRNIFQKFPLQKDPRATVKKWIDENNMFQILKATQFVLDLIKKDEQQITDLFSGQINQIGTILLTLSLMQIPILIFAMLFVRKKYIEFVSEKLECTQNVYKHIAWNMLSENTYAINYFEDKLKKSKQH